MALNVSISVLLFLIASSFFVNATATPTGFISTPTSVNAILGSTATFRCSATRGIISWIINGSLLSDLNPQNITSTGATRTRSLHVPALEKYNNTVVRCAIASLDDSEWNYSDPAVLRVQGLLNAVGNLKSESLGQVIHLTWDAPFSLDITGVDPDIWYHVDLTVDKDSFNISSINPYFITSTVNVSEFTFKVDDHNNTSTSVIYEFRVTPINGAGNGTTSAPVTGYFSGRPRSITPDMVVTSGTADPLNVDFTITYLGAIPPGEMPDGFQFFAETDDGGDKLAYCTDDTQVAPSSDWRVFIQLNTTTPTRPSGSSSLEPHRRYKVIITAKNRAGGTNSTGDIHFSTHDAQNCTTECFRPNTVNVSCAFPVNSTALGYLSILCFDNSSRVMFFAASRGDMSNSDLNISISGVPSGNYSVVVFDIGNSGVPPVLSADYDGSGWPYALAAGIQNVTVTEPGRSGDENENMTVKTEAKVASVNGILKEVPNGQVELCVNFESNMSGDKIVVFAHRVDDSEKLSACHLNLKESNCTSAPAPGRYFFSVFTNGGSLNEPLTPPTISFDIVPTMSPTPSAIPPAFSMFAVVVSVLAATLVAGAAVFAVIFVFMKTKAKKPCMVLPCSGTCSATNHEKGTDNGM